MGAFCINCIPQFCVGLKSNEFISLDIIPINYKIPYFFIVWITNDESEMSAICFVGLRKWFRCANTFSLEMV